jgi:hypothetical protein
VKKVYRVLRPLIHDGREYGPPHPNPLRLSTIPHGEEMIELFDHEAAPLLAVGCIEPMS